MRRRASTARIVVSLIIAAGCGGSTGQAEVVPNNVPTSHDTGVADTSDDETVAPEFDASQTDSAVVDTNTDGVIPGIVHDIPIGTPITATDGTWTRIEFPTGYCRNGESAHLMVHLNGKSKKFLVYLEGGGACFNDASCNLLTADLPSYVLGGGIFNFTRADNPFRDWNIFYVPYCTGDVHAGDIAESTPGPVTGKTRFSGYSNMKLYLSRILATMPDATDEALAGSSAGGFGVGLMADLIVRNSPASVDRFTMIDDSGPPMAKKYIPTCLQAQWQSIWGLDNTILKDCGLACPKVDDFVTDYVQFLIDKYAKGSAASKFMAGLVSSTGDSVISTFFGFGANDCTMTAPLSAATYKAGLSGIRSLIQPQTDHFGTFYYESTLHTTLLTDVATGVTGGLYDTNVGGIKLTDWLADLLAHKKAAHVGP
ncbi:MAG: pectin acetylesterase-family hydrolase [Polyangiales bacterium]